MPLNQTNHTLHGLFYFEVSLINMVQIQFFDYWHINISELSNAESILAEELSWY